MREIATSCIALVSALLIVWMGIGYCLKIVRNQAHPRITTWIIFEIGVVMSLITYLSSPTHSFVRNITNTTDCVTVAGILAVLIVKRQGGKMLFLKTERWCLKIAVAVFILWSFSRSPWVGVAGFQVVMVIAYFPTFENLWHWKKDGSPEPGAIWAIETVAALLGVGIAVAGNDYLAVLYPLRATILCVIILLLIKRLERRDLAVATEAR